MFFNRRKIKELSLRVAELEGSVAALMLAVIDLDKRVNPKDEDKQNAKPQKPKRARKPKKNDGKENADSTK